MQSIQVHADISVSGACRNNCEVQEYNCEVLMCTQTATINKATQELSNRLDQLI